MGYAQEYHVERYMREVFVPRIAPISQVGDLGTLHAVEEMTKRLIFFRR